MRFRNVTRLAVLSLLGLVASSCQHAAGIPSARAPIPTGKGAPLAMAEESPRDLEPYVSLTSQEGVGLTLVEMSVRAVVDDPLSFTELRLTFENPEERTLLELAETIKRITGATSEIVFEALPVDDPQQRRPNITRAEQILGWTPEISLEEGLSRLLRALGREPAGV